MNIGELINIKSVEDEEQLFGQKRTAYRDELRLFSCVQQGDIDKLMNELMNLDSVIVTGKMSNDETKQYKYMAVSAITLATRYAIQGGLNENEAYKFSDNAIIIIDSLTTKSEILFTMASEILRLTECVRKNKLQPFHSPHVKKCIRYINDNLDKKLTVSVLSEHCGISPDYLSQIFKKELSVNLSSYITERKLEKAKELLLQKKTSSEICALLRFSSQAYFTTAFKKYYNMTPSEYSKLMR